MRPLSPYIILLLLTLAFATLPAASSQADFIALFGDSLRTDCSVSAGAGDFAVFYVYHYSSSGATGSRFQLPKPACLVFDLLGPSTLAEFPHTGDFGSGIEFQYGACLTGWIYLGRVYYFDVVGLGAYPPCCEYPPVAHPSSTTGQVEAFDCAGVPYPVVGLPGIFNGGESCPCDVATSVNDPGVRLPARYELSYNYPNPFNPMTTLHYSVPVTGGMVSISIYDVQGRLVQTLANGFQPPGNHRVEWDGSDRSGRQVQSGVYFVRMQAPGFEQVRKITLIK